MTATLNSASKTLLDTCKGESCKNSKGYNEVVQSIAKEHLSKKTTINDEEITTNTDKKNKGKFKPIKSMSLDHKQEEISEIVKREVEKATKGTQQTTTQVEANPHKAHLEAMPPGVNYLNCKNCGAMKNPRGLTKKYKACDNCQANTVHPEAEVCPFCGNSDKDGFSDDGIEIEDEQ